SPPRARARDRQVHGTTRRPRRTGERVSRETKASRAGARGGGREPEESPESRSGAGLEQAWSRPGAGLERKGPRRMQCRRGKAPENAVGPARGTSGKEEETRGGGARAAQPDSRRE